MKYWKRIFLFSVIFALIIINGTGIVVIEKTYRSNFNRALIETINNKKDIINIITLNYSASAVDLYYYNEVYGYDVIEAPDESAFDTQQKVGQWLNIYLRNYVTTSLSQIKDIQVYYEGKKISSLNNSKFVLNNKLNSDYDLDNSKFIIQDINGSKIVQVAQDFKLDGSIYKLVLYRDITFLYNEKAQNYKTFIFVAFFINISLIIGIYIIAKFITKPIVNLADISMEISKGNYSKRIQFKDNSDEISILSKNFNDMMEVLEYKIDELEQMNHEKERFIDSLTHEIKTPITSIIGYSDLLLKRNIDENMKVKALSYINSQGRRLENLSSTLVKLILIKKHNEDNDIFSLKELLINARETLMYKIDDKNIIINSKVEDIKIKGDRQLILVLFINLLDNAIKASSHNSEIIIKGALNENRCYEVVIRDFGVGIPSEDLAKIKEPFYMVDKSRDRKNNGVGLGLSICSEICTRYKMKLDINSKLGKGTSVKVCIEMGNDTDE